MEGFISGPSVLVHLFMRLSFCQNYSLDSCSFVASFEARNLSLHDSVLPFLAQFWPLLVPCISTEVKGQLSIAEKMPVATLIGIALNLYRVVLSS